MMAIPQKKTMKSYRAEKFFLSNVGGLREHAKKRLDKVMRLGTSFVFKNEFIPIFI